GLGLEPVRPKPSSSLVTLRPYQEEAISATLRSYENGLRRAMVVLATGLGKTICAADLTRRMQQMGHGRVLFMAHREELIFQSVDKMKLVLGHDANVGIVKAEYNEPD